MARSSTSWAPGTTGNPAGRAPRAVESRYAEMFREACTPDDWQRIIKKAVSQAKAGDRHARRWLADYLIGRPTGALDLGAADAALLTLAIQAMLAVGVEPHEAFRRMIARAQTAADIPAEAGSDDDTEGERSDER